MELVILQVASISWNSFPHFLSSLNSLFRVVYRTVYCRQKFRVFQESQQSARQRAIVVATGTGAGREGEGAGGPAPSVWGEEGCGTVAGQPALPLQGGAGEGAGEWGGQPHPQPVQHRPQKSLYPEGGETLLLLLLLLLLFCCCCFVVGVVVVVPVVFVSFLSSILMVWAVLMFSWQQAF